MAAETSTATTRRHIRATDTANVPRAGSEVDLGPEAGELLATALRLAQSPDTDTEPARSAATRRADAPTDPLPPLPRPPTNPPRRPPPPHLNLTLDLDRYPSLPGAGAANSHGRPLDRTTTNRVLCDAALHRVLTHGRSAILDYGTTVRTR